MKEMVNTNLILADLQTYALEHPILCLCDLCKEVDLFIEEAAKSIAANSKDVAEGSPPHAGSFEAIFKQFMERERERCTK